MFKKETPEQLEMWARPKWALSMDDLGSIVLMVVGYVMAIVVPMVVAGEIVNKFWPAPPPGSFALLVGSLPIVAAFGGVTAFNRIVVGRIRKWLQAREIPANEEIQDRLQTATEDINQ